MSTSSTPIILFGASGHGKVVADIINRMDQYHLVGFVDDNPELHNELFFGFPVLGGREELLAWRENQRVNPCIVVSIGANAIRRTISLWLLENDFTFGTAIHPSSEIATDVSIGAGTVIMARAVINSSSSIGEHCIINTCASVDHDCILEDFVHIAPGSRLCGLVTMKSGSMLGAGGIVIPTRTVHQDSMVGAGATVVKDVPANSTVVGVPATEISSSSSSSSQALDPLQSPYRRQSLKKMTVLFTCAGRRHDLLRLFRASMDNMGLRHRLLVADAAKYSSAGCSADEIIKTPHVSDQNYIPFLHELVLKKDIKLVIPLTDLDLYLLAEHKALLEQDGCVVMTGDPKTIEICNDKKRFGEYLQQHGIPTIPSYLAPDFLKAPFFPCFAKPIDGSGSIAAEKLTCQGELQQHFRDWPHQTMLFQPYIQGQEFTIDFYKSRLGEIITIVPRQRLRIRAGEVEQGLTRLEDDLLAASRQVADAFPGLWGVFCAQCRRTPEGEILFYELNPRFGGGSPLSFAAGADLALYLLQDVLGLAITPPESLLNNLLMMRYPAACYCTISNPSLLPGFSSPKVR